MALDDRETERRRLTRRRGAPGSKPTLKAFLPYVLLGIVMVAIVAWMALGPQGADRGEPLRAESPVDTVEQLPRG